MKNFWRIEKFPKKKSIQELQGIPFNKKEVIYLEGKDLSSELAHTIASKVLVNSLSEDYQLKEEDKIEDFSFFIDKSFHFGVTDNSANAIKECIKFSFPQKEIQVSTGEIYFFKNNPEQINLSLLGNHLLHRFHIGEVGNDFFNKRFEKKQHKNTDFQFKKAKVVNVQRTIEELQELNKKNCWALNTEELKCIKDYFFQSKVADERNKKGISANPTDLEIEIIAQTWSEHCKHKIFQAEIEYSEKNIKTQKKLGNFKLQNLFKDKIKKASSDAIEKHGIEWAISLFKDNAGIVRFDPNIDLCAKVETHNSPSALDPYGGALTGILGVNRDILGCGMGSLPIANTNVFCVGSQKSVEENSLELPKSLLSPKMILDGVHQGVKDGGNKSGIPTVNGAIVFDDDYMGKPLVYCGTIGTLPQKVGGHPSSEKPYFPGDRIFMIGGRVGMDGIHGATFSSLELDESSPSSAVQIGDPITQKRVLDFLMEARDKNLYTGITDNGAGGLSSSIGEMAEATNGAKLDLSKVPLKYPGLSPYQIMISESQERMSLAVSPQKKNDFLELAKKYQVEASDIGEFTDNGFLDVFYQEELIGHLPLDFLHNGTPQLKLKAEYTEEYDREFWHKKDTRKKVPNSAKEILIDMLKRPNIRSKDHYVRQYDQEVKAQTIIKPFNGKRQNSPSGASLIKLEDYGGNKDSGVILSCGINPKLSHYDCYHMTLIASDEAIRNAVSLGANLKKISLLDNYCWPDPIDSPQNPEGKKRLAQLVRSAEALYEVCTTYGAPLISGKDSMKNNFQELGIKIAVPPTLLVTCMAYIENCKKAVTSSFKKAGDSIYLLSPYTFEEMYSFSHISEFSFRYQVENCVAPIIDIDKNFQHYQKLSLAIDQEILNSCHDISDGGNVIAILESSFGNHLGAKISSKVPHKKLLNTLYNEPSGTFLVSISPENENKLEKLFPSAKKLGEVSSEPRFEFYNNDEKIIDCSLIELEGYWRNDNVF